MDKEWKQGGSSGMLEWLFHRNFANLALALAAAIVFAVTLGWFLALSVLYLFILAGIITVLIWQYRRSGDRGFLWLALPVVVWPLVAGPVELWNEAFLERLREGEEVGFFPYSLVSNGQLGLGDLIAMGRYLKVVCRGALFLLALATFNRHTNQAE